MSVQWNLTSSGFERLLGALDGDRDRAAAEYPQLQCRVAGLLRWWGASDYEALADTTLDRVARRLGEGQQVTSGALNAYVSGVARMVYYESVRAMRRQRGCDAEWAAPAHVAAEARLDRLAHALDRLSDRDRLLLLQYYGEGVNHERRRRVAARLGITTAALRVRAHRLRQRLLQSFAEGEC